MLKSHLGVIGMGVMGKNLTFNIIQQGYQVSIFNRSKNKISQIISENINKKLLPFFSLKDFVNSLQIPRCIILMIKSGNPIDEIIDLLLPFISNNDLIVDAGNSFYKDTIRRDIYLQEKGIKFLGVGISGGEEGALKGPSIMPGGCEKSYIYISSIFKKIAAKFDHEPCVEYIGPNGSGHYVKMVHNGIEYSDMQLISESYFLLKNLLGLNNLEISETFKKWNQGELNSYLMEITSHIFSKKNKKGDFLIDLILDEASNKGTGMWAAQSALDLHVPASLITESVYARYLSFLKSQRVIGSTLLKGPKLSLISESEREIVIEDLRRALFLGKILSYTQGFFLMKIASEKYSWNLNFFNIAKIFRSGCIIRARFLKDIMEEFLKNNYLISLLFTSHFKNIANKYESSLRRILLYSIKNGISVPLFSASLAYYDGYRSEKSSANLIQAQRDYFGSHTYKMLNKTGNFHTNWND